MPDRRGNFLYYKAKKPAQHELREVLSDFKHFNQHYTDSRTENLRRDVCTGLFSGSLGVGRCITRLQRNGRFDRP